MLILNRKIGGGWAYDKPPGHAHVGVAWLNKPLHEVAQHFRSGVGRKLRRTD